MRVDTVWRNARLATMADAMPGLGIIENGAIVADRGRILYCGDAFALPGIDPVETIDCDGRWILPGLIDCHTHLVFGGDRVDEFAARLGGHSYGEQAHSGGIRSTVAKTRGATREALLDQALLRVDALIAEGVTTVEIKSGYGLDVDTELRQLAVARDIANHRALHVTATYLGLHALPGEYAGRPDDYVRFVETDMIGRVASERLAESVDAFCETIAFSPEQTDRVFRAARAAGLAVRLHADQLSDLGGAALAARHRALSADHLEYASEAGIAAMAHAGTVAVLLPGAFYTLGETRRPPVAAMRRHGVPIALATDLNPGSSPLASPLVAMNLAAHLFGLTVEECLLAMTRNAAASLGRTARSGTLQPGKDCDLSIWSVEQPAELVYWIGLQRLHRRVCSGRVA